MIDLKHVAAALIVAAPLVSGATAQAQSAAPAGTNKWSAEFGIGFDNSISGNINSGAIGTLNNQTTVITKNSYERCLWHRPRTPVRRWLHAQWRHGTERHVYVPVARR